MAGFSVTLTAEDLAKIEKARRDRPLRWRCGGCGTESVARSAEAPDRCVLCVAEGRP